MDGLFLGHILCSLFATVKSLCNILNYRFYSPKAFLGVPLYSTQLNQKMELIWQRIYLSN